MRRVGAVAGATMVAVAAALVGQLLVAPAGATGAGGPAPGTAAPTAAATAAATVAASAADERFERRARFSRERVRRGDSDASPRAIEHVRELQYRLRWIGVYNGPVTGYFGDQTLGAVKRFQREYGFDVTGVVSPANWARLIKKTVRNRAADACKHGRGLHACYDRRNHQVTLWRGQKMWNSWLVRGGDVQYATRVGDWSVFSRDRDHVSGIYGTPMPFSQFFSGGQAFHGSPFMLDPFVGHSHGCVNMYIEDARQLWSLTIGQPLRVHVYGAWS